jgi:hypothetical protein
MLDMPTLSVIDHATIYRNPEPNRVSEYVAFPSIQALPDNTLLCMCRHGSARESLDGRVRLHRSSDGGYTWQMLPELPDPQGDLEGWWLPGGFGVTATGDVLAWIVQAGCEPRRIHLYRSSDSGVTWEQPTEVDLNPFAAMGPGGNLALLSDGTLIAGGESKGGGPGAEDAEWVSLITRSTDYGRTWEPVRIAHRSTRPHYFDLRFTALPDDRLLAAYWTQDMAANEGLNVHMAWSDDDGRTWSEPQDSGFWGQVTDVLALRSGRVLAATNHRREPLGIRLLLSEDDGASFGAPLEIWGLEPPKIRSAPMLAAERDVATNALQAYHHFTFGTPSATQLSDGTIVVAFYVTEANVTYVRCCHLKETP